MSASDTRSVTRDRTGTLSRDGGRSRHRLQEELTRGLKRWQSTALPIAQAGLAAGVSWLVAVHIVGHRSPFFAPIAAVICLGITLGQRLRRGIELVAGVSIGIGVGDLLISVIGTGPSQIALVVALAMSAAVFLDGGPVITVQSAVSAVLVATVYLPDQTSGVSRVVDALIGGAVALIVAAALPANPLTVVHRHAAGVLGELADALHGAARAIERRDLDKAAAVLNRAREAHQMVDELRTALQVAEEIATIAPIRRHRRPELDRYLTLLTPVDYALGDTRVLIRRAAAALQAGEAMPHALDAALDRLGDAVELLCIDLADGKEPIESRSRIQTVARSTSADVVGDCAFSGEVVLAQLRSTLVDLLEATGMTPDAARDTLPALNRGKENCRSGSG